MVKTLHISNPNLKTNNNILEKDNFDDYQLAASLNSIKAFIIIIGLINLALILPDSINLSSTANKLAAAIVFRGIYILLAACLFIWLKKIKNFKVLAFIVTVYEVIAILLFLYILDLYDSPDYLIQLMGVMIIIVAIFIIPNVWLNTLIVATLVAAAFIFFSIFEIEGISSMQIWASVFYLIAQIALCSLFTFCFKRYQYGEFLAKNELRSIYSTDTLTKVGNRRKLEDEAEKWMEFCIRHNLQLSLVLIDIDNLKTINDEYGHLAGDSILYETAQVMRSQLRKNDVCVRWGGDEFVLLLPYTDVDEAMKLSERIRVSIANLKINDKVATTCSFGITSMRRGDNLDQILHRADSSMYLAKEHGKNRVEIED